MKKPVYAIFGLGGLIANSLSRYLSSLRVEDYRIFAFDHARVNVANPDHVIPLLDFVQPTVVFNCAGMSDLDRCEQEPEKAYSSNATGPEVLGSMCSDIGAKFVHFSSWAVFNGESDRPYGERSVVSPISLCGRAKLEGESAAMCFCPDALVIRSGWVFGEDAKGRIPLWLDQAERGQPITVPSGKKVSPVYVDDLVGMAVALSGKKVKGIYHVANSGSATIEGIARFVLRTRGYDESLVNALSDDVLQAAFPEDSVLSINKVKRVLRKNIRPWDEAIQECLARINNSVGGT